MTEREKRAQARREQGAVKIVNLKSLENHSFHFGLSDMESFTLLRKMSLAKWEEENGMPASPRVDKTKFKIISLKDK